MEPQNFENVENAVDLGTWLGRRQAFAVVAGRCSAAEAECLRTIREKKMYRTLEDTWEEFCRKHAGLSRSTADLVIRQLEEFGPAYFHLASVARISPETFRLIAPSVSEEGVQYGEERIPFSAQNATRIAAAVEDLRERAEAQAQPAPKAAPDLPRRLRRAQKAQTAVIAEMESVSVQKLDLIERQSLRATIEQGLKKLERLTLTIPR